MLTLTSEAAARIRGLVEHPDNPNRSGLRITDDTSGRFVLSLAAEPANEEQVIDTGGAHVFLDPTAAKALDEQTLHATTDAQGRVRFSVAPRTTASEPA
jgi:Fe-S cluster assembly iron-binding protein IscA